MVPPRPRPGLSTASVSSPRTTSPFRQVRWAPAGFGTTQVAGAPKPAEYSAVSGPAGASSTTRPRALEPAVSSPECNCGSYPANAAMVYSGPSASRNAQSKGWWPDVPSVPSYVVRHVEQYIVSILWRIGVFGARCRLPLCAVQGHGRRAFELVTTTGAPTASPRGGVSSLRRRLGRCRPRKTRRVTVIG